MKFSCQATELMSALKAAQSVTDARPVRPIYECVLIEAEGNDVYVTGGNSEQQIRARVSADVQDEGIVAVPLKVLIGYISALTEEVKIASDKNGGIALKAGNLKAVVAGQDVNDYTIVNIDSDPVFTANASEFSNVISSVAFAANPNDEKRILKQVHVEVDQGGHGTAVAMSDRKMGNCFFSTNMIADSAVEVGVPLSVIKPLCSVLSKSETFALTMANHVVRIDTDDRTFIFPDLVGNYIEWRNILKRINHDKFAKADIKGLADAIRFSGVSGKNGETFLANLHFSSKNQTLAIVSRGIISDSTAEIGVDYSGDDVDIAFDVRVIQEAVAFCAEVGAEDVEIGLSATASIASVRPLTGNDSRVAYVMPVRQLSA